jgi:ABC-type polysaccharide/polyol phosphate export permease
MVFTQSSTAGSTSIAAHHRLAVAATVLALVAAILDVLVPLAPFAIALAVLAVVFGVLGRGHTTGKIGLIVGALALIGAVAVTAWLVSTAKTCHVSGHTRGGGTTMSCSKS